MKPFKFLSNPLLYTHDGHRVFVGDIFYSVNKEDIVSFKGSVVPKYTISTRQIPEKHRNRFKPDYDVLWYFKSKSNAEWLIDIWKGQDKLDEWHEKQRTR